eukprot:2045850-Prymnesium_polylepis.1
MELVEDDALLAGGGAGFTDQDWQAVLDEATGKVYYWNTRTNMVSWDPDDSNTAEPVDESGSVDTAGGSSQGYVRSASSQELGFETRMGGGGTKNGSNGAYRQLLDPASLQQEQPHREQPRQGKQGRGHASAAGSGRAA